MFFFKKIGDLFNILNIICDNKKKPSRLSRDGFSYDSAMNISFFADLSALDVVDHFGKPVDLLFGIVEGE